jgi:hypothetical protein
MNELVGRLVEILIRKGSITDAEKVCRRLRLGYPAWLVLKELGSEKTSEVLSRMAGFLLLTDEQWNMARLTWKKLRDVTSPGFSLYNIRWWRG